MSTHFPHAPSGQAPHAGAPADVTTSTAADRRMDAPTDDLPALGALTHLADLADLPDDLAGDWLGETGSDNAAPASRSADAAGTAPVPLAMRETLRRVPVKLTLEVGATRLTLGELAALRADDVLSLDRAAGAPLAVLVNGVPVGLAEVVVSGAQYGLKILTLDALELDRLAP
ncbi:FliM/FliN family flagellar motor switch protein [Pandoraea cepalis]|uniref:Flagellar motor switch protein FliN n=1 Tax=Pandoraea cepalis TaxID=2508294 RepID=A0A5E4WFQ6_9BURK|nr:FliM/FliN family flagellar motor switch protein [Pandoraea cepalis]VVE22270.1 flagellar motor switch protein FliN [Pandoraea cepalis]